MLSELDQVGRDLAARLTWLLGEIKRLRARNARLLAENRELRAQNAQWLNENRELREEVTFVRLQSELRGELPDDLADPTSTEAVLSREALEFYRSLPDTINVADFFRRAESVQITGERARQLMLQFFREGLIEQKGRRLEKRLGRALDEHPET